MTRLSQYAFAYLQPSLIPVPTIPRYFLARQNVVEQPSTYVKSENVLDLQCTLGIIFYRAMNYCTNPIGKLGQSEDLQTRSLLYDELLEWERAIPPLTQFEVHSNFLYSFLRYITHLTAFHFRVLLFRLPTTSCCQDVLRL